MEFENTQYDRFVVDFDREGKSREYFLLDLTRRRVER